MFEADAGRKRKLQMQKLGVEILSISQKLERILTRKIEIIAKPNQKIHVDELPSKCKDSMSFKKAKIPLSFSG